MTYDVPPSILAKRCRRLRDFVFGIVRVGEYPHAGVWFDQRYFMDECERRILTDLGLDIPSLDGMKPHFILWTIWSVKRYFGSSHARMGSRLYNRAGYGMPMKTEEDKCVLEDFTAIFEFALAVRGPFEEFLGRYFAYYGYNIDVKELLRINL